MYLACEDIQHKNKIGEERKDVTLRILANFILQVSFSCTNTINQKWLVQGEEEYVSMIGIY